MARGSVPGWVFAGLAIAGGVLLFGRSAGGAAAHSAPPASPTLLALLASSEEARAVFATQAALYSAGLTNVPPSGAADHATGEALLALDRALGEPAVDLGSALTRLHSGESARRVARFYAAQRPRVRLLPFALPRQLITDVNREALARTAGFPLVQVR